MIKIYTKKGCEYCNKLKIGLDKEGLKYLEIDIDKNRTESDKVFKFTGVDLIPIIIIKPHVLVPTKSFNTIEQAIDLIKSFN